MSLIFLNSENRISGTNTDALFYLSNYNYPQRDINLSIESFQMPSLQYGIRAGFNNLLIFAENNVPGVLKTATITPGSYDGNSLAAEVQTRMNAVASNTYTVSFSLTTKRMTITTTIPNNFIISQTSTILNVLGYSFEISNTFSTFNATHNANCPVDVNDGQTYVDISLPNMANNNIISSYISNSIFYRVPITVNFGSIITYNATTSDTSTTISGETLNSIQVRILNPNGTLYQLDPNHSFSLVLRVSPA